MGAADRTTKLVARELRRRGVRLIEEVLRIELIVTNELKQRAVNFVRSGLARYVDLDRKSTRLNSSHVRISYAVFCLKKKNKKFKLTDMDRSIHVVRPLSREFRVA